MSEIVNCVIEKLPSVLSKVFGVDEALVKELVNTGKIKITPTPDPKLGDYGIALHPLLKNIDRNKWDLIGTSVSEEFLRATRESCWVEKTVFVNGYVNFYVDYFNMLKKIGKAFVEEEVFRELWNIGRGDKVIVEHTSANPIHPLHIGSGRNSVIGDTYARLLRKLGFNVETRYYVNDLGRQVATLVYGVRIVESKGLSKPEGVKVDHWYGVIYAMTHVIIEMDRLRNRLRERLLEFVNKADYVCRENSMYMSHPKLRDIWLLICEVSWKKNLKTDLLKNAKRIYLALRQIDTNTGDQDVRELYRILQDIKSIVAEYREYSIAERKLSEYYPEIYDALKNNIRSHIEAEKEISRLMYLAEREDPDTLMLFRRVSSSVLEGFRQTLSSIGIDFNGFDYESSDVILKTAHEIVEMALKTPFARIIEGGAVEIDLNALSSVDERVKKLFYPDQAGRFVIRRSDGTTLYVTRDIAYTLFKFRELGAKKVYNVIAVEQTREQKQLKSILYLLGYDEYADNMYHFAYEMVHLKGMRMSGRRGVYYTIDEMLIDNKMRILSKLLEKTQADRVEVISIAEKLAIANTRAILLSVEPGKVLVFDPSRLGETEYGVIIEYGFVRAQGIIRNLWGIEFLTARREIMDKTKNLLDNLVKTDLSIEEKRLIENIARYKNILLEAYSELKPNKILEYAISLALDFNKFYEKCSILGELDADKKNTRVLITVLTAMVLSELLDILGIPKLSRM